MKSTILIIDDEESIRFAFKRFLSGQKYTVLEAEDFPSALQLISCNDIDVIFSDILLKDFNGIDLLRKIKKEKMICPVIMITGQPDITTAADAVRLGAFDYLTKPIDKEMIFKVTTMALDFKALIEEKKRIENENLKYRKNLEAIFRSVSESIITFRNDKTILNANESTHKICGVNPESIIGKKMKEIYHLFPLLGHESVKKNIEESYDIRELRISYKLNDTTQKTVVLNSSPLLDADNSNIGTVLAIRDESKLAVLEKELNERYRFHNIIGKSNNMQRIYNLIENLSMVDTTVLITGESGTGKELVAGALHYHGARAANSFVCLNCSTLSENLLESELFGHVKGAFTGAIKNKNGRFYDAHGGSIFLDEIGDISPMIQVKLLRVLQEKEFERVGDSSPIKTNVRVIAATNKDLKKLISQGNFREDLFYRLKVVEINLPPLRERLDDIPLLSNHFIRRFNTKFGKQITGITNDVLHLFMSYSWPGNVRELEHSIEHAFVLCHDTSIAPDHIPVEIKQNTYVPTIPAEKKFSVSDQEILKMLEKTHWNKAKTARLLGISRQTLYRRMKKNKLEH